MSPVAVGWVVAVTFRGTMNNQIVMTTFHYMITEIAAGPIPSNVVSITDINTALTAPGNMQDDYAQAMPSNWSQTAMEYQWIAPIRFRKIAFGNGFPVGGNINDAHTSNLAVVISLSGERSGRRFVANKHLPGIADGDFTGGIIGNPTLGDMTAVAAQSLANLVTPELTLVPIIYGRFIAPFVKCGVNKPGQAELKTPVAGAAVKDTVRVMRRRTVGVGI